MDWNDDGYLDVLIGGRDGQVKYYEGIPTDAIPVLTYVGQMQASGSTIDVGNNSAPLVVDWNEDGLLDLMIGAEGNSTGTISTLRLYLNSGSAGNPLLTSYNFVKYKDTDIVEYRCTPHTADINDDGKKDLVTGNWDGFINYYENVGTSSAPVFETQEKLTYTNGTPIDVSYSCRPFMVDWDEDGVIDIVAGNYYGNVHLYLGQFVGVEGGTGTTLASTSISVAGSPTTGPFQLMLGFASQQAVTVEFFDLTGRIIQNIQLGNLTAGEYTVNCDLNGHSPGVYFARLVSGNECPTVSIVLID